MFCDQREQTADGKACADKMGVCRQVQDAALLRDKLTGALIGLARATEGNEYRIRPSTDQLILEGLAATQTNADFGEEHVCRLLDRVETEKRHLAESCYCCAMPCGRTGAYDMQKLWNEPDGDIRNRKEQILLGIQSVAAKAYPALRRGHTDENICRLLYKALIILGIEGLGRDRLAQLVQEIDEAVGNCTALQDGANTNS